MEWVLQGQDSCCFVYAAANVLVYEAKPVPNLEPIKDIACCRHGATIHTTKVLEALGLSLRRTDQAEDVFRNGGILTIHHPIFNLHSVFVAPQQSGRVLAVNSFLGPTAFSLEPEVLARFLPKAHLSRHYARN